jgi:hypothetical protein
MSCFPMGGDEARAKAPPPAIKTSDREMSGSPYVLDKGVPEGQATSLLTREQVSHTTPTCEAQLTEGWPHEQLTQVALADLPSERARSAFLSSIRADHKSSP